MAMFAGGAKLVESFQEQEGACVGGTAPSGALWPAPELLLSNPATIATWEAVWIPALEHAIQLEAGREGPDGSACGPRRFTIIMAQHYPKSTFVGFANHEARFARPRFCRRRPVWRTE